MLDGHLQKMADGRYFLYLVDLNRAMVEITLIQFEELAKVLPICEEK